MKRLAIALAMLLLPAAMLLAAGKRLVVIPVEFSDVRFCVLSSNTYPELERSKDYLSDQFGSIYGQFTIDIMPVVRLTNKLSYYGANSTTQKDEFLAEAIKVACIQTKASYSIYDNDNDGYVDNVCIITAGRSESDGGGADCIWPQQGFLHEHGGTIMAGGMTIDCYTVCSEYSTAGTFCHELGHVFGLQDLYDTDGRLSGGTCKGLWGTLSLMDWGGVLPCLSAIELETLGIGTPVEPDGNHVTLRPIGTSREYMRLESGNPGEYFLLECRSSSGWDECVGGRGLVVYHIDKSLSDAWYSDAYGRSLTAAERWELNQINCRPEHPCAKVVEAVPGTDNVAEVFFPQNGRTAFGAGTDPSFRYWSGETSERALNNITVNGDGSVSFDLIIPIAITGTDVFQDAAIISWTVDGSMSVSRMNVTWHDEANRLLGSNTLYPNEKGIYAATLEGLEPLTAYSATVQVVTTSGPAFHRSVSFRTKSRSQNARPFIYLNSVERQQDGSFAQGTLFPLRIYNASNVNQVIWYHNGLRIFPTTGGYWEATTSGDLKAEVWYTDGSCEIITKQITVR